MCVGPSSRRSLVAREASHDIMIWHGLVTREPAQAGDIFQICPRGFLNSAMRILGTAHYYCICFHQLDSCFHLWKRCFFHRCSTIMRSVRNAIIRNKHLIAPSWIARPRASRKGCVRGTCWRCCWKRWGHGIGRLWIRKVIRNCGRFFLF